MKKVLIVITTSFVPYGGLTTVMMNYYRAMNKEGLQIDFASTNEPETSLLDELKKNNSRYFCLGERKRNLLGYINKLRKLLAREKYDVIHVNGNSATMLFELFIAKMCNVKKRIAHGHNTQTSYPVLNDILKKMFKRTLTTAVAVSSQTGDWLYGENNYVVLKNAIDLDKYKFNNETRMTIRDQLNINDKYVIGTVGKLNYQKNHEFLIEVFKKIYDKNHNVHLLIVGGGALEQELKEKVNELKITNAVTMTGMKSNASEFLQAMDVFVFPSRFEGFGLSLIEAQASGLHCIASDTIPKETNVSDCVEYLDLKEDIKVWGNGIMNLIQEERREVSARACTSISNAGYDILLEASNLEKMYLM